MARYPLAGVEEGNVASGKQTDVLVLGWADTVDAGLLPGGGESLLARSINVRLESGQPETRLGVVTPHQFNPPALSLVRGAGVFSDPASKREWMLLADGAGIIWRLADDATPLPLAISGAVLEGAAEIVQAYARVMCYRGTKQEPLLWDGDITHPWIAASAVPQEAEDYTRPIPPADTAVIMAGRSWTWELDFLIPSLIYKPERYDPAQVLRINQGEADNIVMCVPFEESRMIILKTGSVHSLDNVSASLGGLTAVKHSDTHGCAARKTARMIGERLFWLGHGAVHSVTVNGQGKLFVDALPLSQGIGETIRRINWAAASTACAGADTRYYYLAVPIDGATINNALLVYDHTLRQWASMDLFDWVPGTTGIARPIVHTLPLFPILMSGGPMGVPVTLPGPPAQVQPVAAQTLLPVLYCGRRCMALVDGARVMILNQNRGEDLLGEDRYPLRTVVRYRGMQGQEPAIKRATSTNFSLLVWNAEIAVNQIAEGQRTLRKVRSIRTDRTRWRFAGRKARPLNNSMRDAHADDREDYALYTSDAAVPGEEGLPVFREAVALDGAALSLRGRWVCVEFTCVRGHMRITAMQSEWLEDRGKLNRQ